MSRESVNFSDIFSFSRASTATNSEQISAPFSIIPVNQPRFSGGGIVVERAATNILLNSETPATQTVTVTNGFPYTLTSYGTGSGYAFVSDGGSGTAPIGNPITFTTQATSVEISVSGDLDGFQLEIGSRSSSFIPTGGAASTRSAENLIRTFGSEFNDQEGTFFLEFDHTYYSTYGTNLILSNGSSRSLIRSTANNSYQAYDGTITRSYPSVQSPSEKEKLAISISDGQWILARNGTANTEVIASSPMLDITALKFFEVASGVISKFEYWPFSKPANELEEITSHPPAFVSRIDVSATISDVGSDSVSGFTEAGFSYDFSANNRYFGTCSITVLETVDIFGILLGDNGKFRVLLKHSATGAIPSNFFNGIQVEGVGLLSTENATYTASLGTSGHDTTEWEWDIGGNIATAGWSDSSSQDIQFIGVIENVS